MFVTSRGRPRGGRRHVRPAHIARRGCALRVAGAAGSRPPLCDGARTYDVALRLTEPRSGGHLCRRCTQPPRRAAASRRPTSNTVSTQSANTRSAKCSTVEACRAEPRHVFFCCCLVFWYHYTPRRRMSVRCLSRLLGRPFANPSAWRPAGSGVPPRRRGCARARAAPRAASRPRSECACACAATPCARRCGLAAVSGDEASRTPRPPSRYLGVPSRLHI